MRFSKWIEQNWYVLSTAVECGSLSPPDHGKVQYWTSTYGTMAVLYCDSGYRHLAGDFSLRFCLSNGIWNGTTPACQCKESKWKRGFLSQFFFRNNFMSRASALETYDFRFFNLLPFDPKIDSMFTFTKTTVPPGVWLIWMIAVSYPSPRFLRLRNWELAEFSAVQCACPKSPLSHKGNSS